MLIVTNVLLGYFDHSCYNSSDYLGMVVQQHVEAYLGHKHTLIQKEYSQYATSENL